MKPHKFIRGWVCAQGARRGEDNLVGLIELAILVHKGYIKRVCCYQGCAGRSFFQRGGARTKIRGLGLGEGENPLAQGRAGRGKRTRKSTDPKI